MQWKISEQKQEKIPENAVEKDMALENELDTGIALKNYVSH